MSELGDKRRLFTRCVHSLLGKMIQDDYEPMLGRDGLVHRSHSLHYDGLAIDIDLTKDDVYLDKTEDHLVFGIYWESLHPDCRWGGRFRDGIHYSITYLGIK